MDEIFTTEKFDGISRATYIGSSGIGITNMNQVDILGKWRFSRLRYQIDFEGYCAGPYHINRQIDVTSG